MNWKGRGLRQRARQMGNPTPGILRYNFQGLHSCLRHNLLTPQWSLIPDPAKVLLSHLVSDGSQCNLVYCFIWIKTPGLPPSHFIAFHIWVVFINNCVRRCHFLHPSVSLTESKRWASTRGSRLKGRNKALKRFLRRLLCKALRRIYVKSCWF